jgi:hypothetical protein
MKVRTGFVSNSSSSSFCAYGVYVGEPKELYIKFRKTQPELYDEFVEHVVESYGKHDEEKREEIRGLLTTELDSTENSWENDWRYCEWGWTLQDFLSKRGYANICIDYGEECIYMTRDYETLGDNETGKEFRETTKEIIEKLIGERDVEHINTILSTG